MGNVHSWFHSHQWPESNDNQISKQNATEADMIVAFFDYLVANGLSPEKITILTFYNGQRKLILKGLGKLPCLVSCVAPNVFTVDSYQGEENDVVLLSLVRNNRKGDIGFLTNDNRVCVALSRARRGFYIFGSARLVAKASPLWRKVLAVMESDPHRIGHALPITCRTHGQTSQIKCMCGIYRYVLR
jgi:helicase required for RNAi-mediated heterochromatin assembly 1